MATQSPNLGLTLPIGSENVSRQIINDNNLIIDGAVESNSEALAIVINGDTAPKAITSGQYLFIKNHTTLPTGGYHATANIANGAAVTSSNVAQDADGIANALNGNIPWFNPTSAPTQRITTSGTYTATKNAWYRIILSKHDSALYLNNIAVIFLNEDIRLDTVIPIAKGTVISTTVGSASGAVGNVFEFT